MATFKKIVLDQRKTKYFYSPYHLRKKNTQEKKRRIGHFLPD